MSWTAERTEYVRTKWAEGISAADIAAELGGVTRNAVLGKVHRMRQGKDKPASRGSGTRHASDLAKKRAALFPFVSRLRVPYHRPPRMVEIPKDIPLPANKSLHAVTFAQLDSMHCRWVLGEPSEQLYCGDDQKPGSSYCHRHHAIAYTKPREPETRTAWWNYRNRAA